MPRTIKASLVLLTLSLCALGAIFAPKEKPADREQRTHVVPVNNQPSHRGIWLRV